MRIILFYFSDSDHSSDNPDYLLFRERVSGSISCEIIISAT